MPYYTLVVEPGKTLHAVADGCNVALAMFGKELGQQLTFEGEHPAPYLMDEWQENPHWTNPTISVFVISN